MGTDEVDAGGKQLCVHILKDQRTCEQKGMGTDGKAQVTQAQVGQVTTALHVSMKDAGLEQLSTEAALGKEGEVKDPELEEQLLKPNPDRFVLFPIMHHDIWGMWAYYFPLLLRFC